MARLFHVEKLRRPHLMLPHVRHRYGVVVAKLAHLFDKGGGFNDVALLAVAEGVFRLHLRHFLKPWGKFGGEIFGTGKKFFPQNGQRPPQITQHTQIHFHVLVYFGGVYFKMHDFRLGGKLRHLPRHPVGKAHTDAKKQIRVHNGHVGGVRAVHTGKAQKALCPRRHAPQAQKRAGDGGGKPLANCADFVCHVAPHHAAAHENKGAFGLFYGFHRRVDFLRVAGVVAVVAFKANFHRVFVFDFRIKNVLGNVDNHRAGAARAGDKKRLLNDPGQSFCVLHQIIMLGDGGCNAANVRFLERILPNVGVAHLPCYAH